MMKVMIAMVAMMTRQDDGLPMVVGDDDDDDDHCGEQDWQGASALSPAALARDRALVHRTLPYAFSRERAWRKDAGFRPCGIDPSPFGLRRGKGQA